MRRKLSLPLSNVLPPPTIEVMRKRLGGRVLSEPGAGDVLSFEGSTGSRFGVALFVAGTEIDVWVGEGRVMKLRAPATRIDPALAPADLAAIAADVRAFVALEEGSLVRYQHDRGIGQGTLLEKCRFGGLVERADGVVLGVGFRRIWRVDPSTIN